jgi:hypothetical protein
LAVRLHDDDEDQERDRKLLWWFRRHRDQAAWTAGSAPARLAHGKSFLSSAGSLDAES